MSAELGAISSYNLAVQNMQMNLIKQNMDLQKQAIEVLFDTSRTVAPSGTLGQNVDVSI